MTAREPLPLEPLKACPFCGGEAKFVGSSFADDIECLTCGAGQSAQTKEEATAKWNRRPPSAREEVIEECAKICDSASLLMTEDKNEAQLCADLAAEIRALAGGKP